MMDGDKLHQPDDEFTAVDDTMMSGNSPYQPTTDPVPHRRAFVGGLILEMRFMKSIAGILKLVEFLFSIAAAVSAGSSACESCAPVTFMQFVSITALLVTALLYIIFAFNLHSKADIVNWPTTDMILCILFFVLYLVASCLLAASSSNAADKSGTAFGFLCCILYAVSTWFAYQVFILDYRKRHSAISHIESVVDHTETEVLS